MEQTFSNKDRESKAISNEIGNEDVLSTQQKSLSPPDLLFAGQIPSRKETIEQVEIDKHLSQEKSSENHQDSNIQLKTATTTKSSTEKENADFIKEDNNSFEFDIPSSLPPPVDSAIQLKNNTNSTPNNKEEKIDLTEDHDTQAEFDVPPFTPPEQPQKNGQALSVAAEKKVTSDGLPPDLLHKMNAAFSFDFSNVKIHKESKKATQMGALAFAQGKDVHFAPGQYKPNSKKGQELIGHELAHVQQQAEGKVKATKQGKGFTLNDSPQLEKEADEKGTMAANGQKLDSPNKASSGLQTLVPFSPVAQGYMTDTIDQDMGNDIIKEENINRILQLLSNEASSSDELKESLTSLYKIVGKNSEDLPNRITFQVCLNHVIITLATRNKFEILYSYSKYVNLKHLKNLSNYVQKVLCKGLSKVAGLSNKRNSAILIHNIKNSEGLLLLGHVDLIWNLNIGDKNSEKVVNILSSNNGNKLLLEVYNQTYQGNFSKNGLEGDIAQKLKGRYRSKALLKLTQGLNNAANIFVEIECKGDPNVILEIVQGALSKNGHQGLQILNKQWKSFLGSRPVHLRNKSFDVNLFNAIEKTFGKNHQAVLIINSFKEGYAKMPEQIECSLEGEDLEREIRLETAKNVLEISMGSNYKDKTGYQSYDKGLWTRNVSDLIKQQENKSKGLSKPKDYNDQLQWAIREIRTIYQEKISISQEPEKSDFEKEWSVQKEIIATSLKLAAGFFNSSNDRSKLGIELSLQGNESINLADQFYNLASDRQADKLLRLAEDVWAQNKVAELHKQLDTPRDNVADSDEINSLRQKKTSPREVLNKFMPESKSDHAFIRIIIMVGKILPQIDIGYNRILHEFNRGKVNKEKFIQFFSKGNTSLMNVAIAKYVDSTAPKFKLIFDTLNLSKRGILLAMIKQSNGLNEKNDDYKDFRDVILPAQDVETIEERAQERYDDSDAKDHTKKSADEARLALEKIRVILRNPNNLDVILKIKGAQNLIELANQPYEELINAIEQLEQEIEADKLAFLEIIELTTYLAITIASGGTASGLLIAAVGSKLVKMGTAELMDPEKNDFFSVANIQELGIEVAVSSISLGLDKAAKAKKFIDFTKKWGDKSMVVAKSIVETSSQTLATAAIKQEVPDLDQLLFSVLSNSISGVSSKQIEHQLKGKKGMIKKGFELGLETIAEAPMALIESQINPDLNIREYLKSLAKKGAQKAGEATKKKKIETNNNSDSKEDVDLVKADSIEISKKTKDDEISSEEVVKKQANSEESSMPLPLVEANVANIDLVDAMLKHDNLSWDQMLDSLSVEKDKNKLINKRNTLSKEGENMGGSFDPNASTLKSSDLDFQFETGKALVAADIFFDKKYGTNYKHKYKVELFISKDRLLATDKISNIEYREQVELSHAELVRTYDLVRYKKYMKADDPSFKNISEEIDALPPKLKKIYTDTVALKPEQRREKTHKLLEESDYIKDALQRQNPIDHIKIDKKLAEISTVQIKINGLSDDGYTSKSVGSLEGKNLNPDVGLATSISNELGLVHKTTDEMGGLAGAAKDYKLYKYLFRPLQAMIKAGVSLTDKQQGIFEIAREVYGTKEHPQRKFYEIFQVNRTDAEFEAILGPLITELHEFQKAVQDRSRGKVEEPEKPETQEE